jgi:hypothetical protein
MSTPESRAKDKAKRMIEQVCARRGLAYKIDWHAGSAFSSTLDATGVVAGHPLVIEVKRFDENESPTARQRINMRQFHEAGAFVVDLVDETALAYLKHWLETLEPREAYYP